MFLENVNILAESTATMKATLCSDAGYNTGVLAASSLGACNAGVLRGRSRCDRSSVPMHRFGRSLLSVGRQQKSDRVGGLARPGTALCWRTTGSLPVAEVPCTTTKRMEIAGAIGSCYRPKTALFVTASSPGRKVRKRLGKARPALRLRSERAWCGPGNPGLGTGLQLQSCCGHRIASAIPAPHTGLPRCTTSSSGLEPFLPEHSLVMEPALL